MSGGGNMAQSGGDPRLSISADHRYGSMSAEGINTTSRSELLGMRDPSVKFEQYVTHPYPPFQMEDHPDERFRLCLSLWLMLCGSDISIMRTKPVPSRMRRQSSNPRLVCSVFSGPARRPSPSKQLLRVEKAPRSAWANMSEKKDDSPPPTLNIDQRTGVDECSESPFARPVAPPASTSSPPTFSAPLDSLTLSLPVGWA